MFGITKAATIQKDHHKLPVREKAFVIPSADDKELVMVYITAIKANAPFEVCHLGGINFEKSVLPDSATLVGNSGKQFFPRLLSKQLTKKQADAIWAEAERREIRVPLIHNPDYNAESKDDSEPPHIQGGYFKMSDWLILEPETTFDPRKYPTADTPWTNPATPVATIEEVQTRLMEEQRQGNFASKAKK